MTHVALESCRFIRLSTSPATDRAGMLTQAKTVFVFDALQPSFTDLASRSVSKYE
jgi:hypothetical protein